MSIAAPTKSPFFKAWVIVAMSEELLAALTATTAVKALKREVKCIVSLDDIFETGHLEIVFDPVADSKILSRLVSSVE